MATDLPSPGPLDVARQVGAALHERNVEYAVGGAIALGYWGVLRGTLDVDVTLFMPHDKPAECAWVLQDIGCEFSSAAALESLRDHGFCRVELNGIRLDVFLPIAPFYG